jgi:hypothetical protein
MDNSKTKRFVLAYTYSDSILLSGIVSPRSLALTR